MKVGIGIGRCKGHSLKKKGEVRGLGSRVGRAISYPPSVSFHLREVFFSDFEKALDVQELVYN